MKIKIIELLAKLANGEKLPEKIKYNERFYYLDFGKVDLFTYTTKGDINERRLSLILDNMYLDLNDYVEIIEEPKKIEKLKPVRGSDLTNLTSKDIVLRNNALIELCKTLNNINNKVNELIDEINKLKEND